MFGRGKIRRLRRDRFEPRAEYQRQAEQRAVQIEVRQRLVAWYDFCRAGEAAHQLAQRFLHLEKHTRGALRDLRHIATELDGVAEALLGVQKNGPAGQIIGAGPKRLREVSLDRAQLRGFPSPFVFLPASGKVSDQEAALKWPSARFGCSVSAWS